MIENIDLRKIYREFVLNNEKGKSRFLNNIDTVNVWIGHTKPNDRNKYDKEDIQKIIGIAVRMNGAVEFISVGKCLWNTIYYCLFFFRYRKNNQQTISIHIQINREHIFEIDSHKSSLTIFLFGKERKRINVLHFIGLGIWMFCISWYIYCVCFAFHLAHSFVFFSLVTVVMVFMLCCFTSTSNTAKKRFRIFKKGKNNKPMVRYRKLTEKSHICE